MIYETNIDNGYFFNVNVLTNFLQTFSQRITWMFVQQWSMQQKVLLLNVNNIGQNMGEEIYSHTLFNKL